MSKSTSLTHERTIYEAQALEDVAAALDGDMPRLISSLEDVARIFGRTRPPRCPEQFCKSNDRPFCHCQSCGETDRFLTDAGYCAECLVAQNVCPICRQTDCCRCAEAR